jgi:hypothetical protein
VGLAPAVDWRRIVRVISGRSGDTASGWFSSVLLIDSALAAGLTVLLIMRSGGDVALTKAVENAEDDPLQGDNERGFVIL